MDENYPMYIVAYCLEQDHPMDGFKSYTDAYERFGDKDGYECALRQYNQVLRYPNLHTASISVELKSTD